MNVIVVYARIYADAMSRALRGIARSPWTLLLPMAISIAYGFLVILVSPLGIVGGLLLGLMMDAMLSAYLFFLGHVVTLSKARIRDVKQSLMAYFWSVLNVFFVMWIANFVIGMLLQGSPRLFGMLSLFQFLFILVMLNATAEAIYLKGTYGGLETLGTAFRFVQENWIEWFLPNALVIAGIYALIKLLVGFGGAVTFFVLPALVGALVHVVMAFRGQLFLALDGSSHRQRMFKYRNAVRSD